MSLLAALGWRRRRPRPLEEPPPLEEPGIGPPTEKDREAYDQIARGRPAAAEGKRVAEEALRLVGPIEQAMLGRDNRRQREAGR